MLRLERRISRDGMVGRRQFLQRPHTSRRRLPMRVVVRSASMQDCGGAALVLDKIRARFPWLEAVWADSGYNARQVAAAVAKVPVLRLEIVKRTDDVSGFAVLPASRLPSGDWRSSELLSQALSVHPGTA